MAIALDRIVRLVRGDELRFAWTVNQELFNAASSRDASLPPWLPELEGAAVNVDQVTAEGCKLRLCSENVCATALLTRAEADGLAFEMRATRHAAGEADTEWSWQHEGLRGMLGGKSDTYLAVDRATGAVPFLRLRYSGAAVEVFALSAAFTHRLSPVLRAMAPAQLKIGELVQPGAIPFARRASPCGCG